MSRESDEQQSVRDGDQDPGAPTTVERQANDGAVSLERINEEIEALTEDLNREGIDFSPKVIRVTKAEADSMTTTVNRIVSSDPSMIDSPHELTKAKSMLAGMLVFLGEIYAEYERLVNLEWLREKNTEVERRNTKGDLVTVHRTDGEVTRIVESGEAYKRMRNLRFKMDGVEKIITSIRDRLGVLSGPGQNGPEDSFTPRGSRR